MALKTPQFNKLGIISKWSAAQKDAYRVVDIYEAAANEVVTLTTTPEMVTVPDGTNTSTAITLPVDPADEGKMVTVINNDAAETVDVGGVTIAADSKTVIKLNSSSVWVKVYAVTLV